MTSVYGHDGAANQAVTAIFTKQVTYLSVIHIETSAGQFTDMFSGTYKAFFIYLFSI
jgi:hypothetical protein